MRRLLVVGIFLLLASLACQNGKPPVVEATPTSTPKPPKVGGEAFGIACRPVSQEVLHGDLAEISLVDQNGLGRVTDFKVGTVIGSGGDSEAREINISQRPESNAGGWSQLPGVVLVDSKAVDGPPRTETYYINILLGGMRGENHITGGNIWCEVKVRHEEPPISTVAATVTQLSPMASATPLPPVITSVPPTMIVSPQSPVVVTKEGYLVTYTGPLHVSLGREFQASFQVVDSFGKPGLGEFMVTLGDPPSDQMASHSRGTLDATGNVALSLMVTWPVGTTKLYFSYAGQVYEMTTIWIES